MYTFDMKKVYVSVLTIIDKEALVHPYALEWNGRLYRIDQVLSCQKGFARTGGCGLELKCRFGSAVRTLWWERDRWFIETNATIRKGYAKGDGSC